MYMITNEQIKILKNILYGTLSSPTCGTGNMTGKANVSVLTWFSVFKGKSV